MLASFAPVLGVMKFDTPPPSFEDWRRIGGMVIDWLQDAGGFAMVGLCLWVLNGVLNPAYDVLPDGRKRNRLIGPGMLLALAVAAVGYLVAFALMLLLASEPPNAPRITFLGFPFTRKGLALEFVMAGAGLVALIGFGGPFIRDCLRMRWGRIYALARLSFQEAVRRRVVWVFLLVLLLWLFPARWFFKVYPQDEVKNIVAVTTRGMNVLLIAVGLLLAAFSIPTDIKNLTIHTVVTKPVERFEIVLGRFLGYLGLLTAGLLGMTGMGLVLINVGNVSEEAEKESLKSRVARYGELEFRSRQADFRGTDVGREDTYRKYIVGHPDSPQRAVWNFRDVPDPGRSDAVPLEFAFDIYRMTKGEEGTGVQVSFDIYTHQWNPGATIDDPRNPGGKIRMQEAYDRDVKGLLNTPAGSANWARVNELAERYGRYEWKNQQIFDYHTVAVPVPAGLLKSAADGTPAAAGPIQAAGRPPRRLQVQAKAETPGQYVGMARHDLYLLESEGHFSLNYFKGAVGVWFRLALALAIAVALSTYLAGVLSFVLALLVFVTGFFRAFILEVALGGNVGGGPLESFARLLNSSATPTMDLDPTPTVRTLQAFDAGYRWLFRRVMNVIPDVDRYGLTEYVAQGFSIGPDVLLIHFATVVGYVLPWLVGAYYLMRAREIAA